MAYGTDTGFEDWLEARGYTLPGAPDLDVLLNRASAYIDATYEPLWTGVRVDPVDQELGWPRTGAKVNCVTAIADDVIPRAVVQATYRAAYLEGATAGILAPSPTTGPRVKRQKVDVIEREFFDDGAPGVGSARANFVDPEIDGAMRAFICEASGGFFFQSIGS